MTLKPRAGSSGQSGKNKSSSSSKRTREDKEAIQLVAQEIKFARALAGNDKKSRDRVLKTLRRWFAQRCKGSYEFKEDDFIRIWKGLFYAVWMSDKPLVQEELCESIAGILDVFPRGCSQPAVLFFGCSMQSLATEWYGLDQHRMDKFLMLVRRLLRAVFRCLRRESWSLEACGRLADAFGAADGILAPTPPAYARNALALQIHIVDCYAEELAKVSEGRLPDASLVELMRPLARCMALSGERRLSGAIKRNLFVHLLRQSERGQDYEERRRAWTQMGCPEGGVDSLVKVTASDDEGDSAGSDDDSSVSGAERPLDPRAGRVDVVLPRLPVPAAPLAAMLRPLVSDRLASTVNRRRVRVCLQHFEDMARGKYPLRASEEPGPAAARERRGPRPARAARRLHEFEKRLNAQSDELALRGLSRKHRKRILAKSVDRLSGGDDVGASSEAAEKETHREKRRGKRRRRSDAGNAQSGEWQVEEAAPSGEKKTKEQSKENKESRENSTQAKKTRTNKRKIATTLQDEVPLKKLKNLLKEKETNESSPKVSKKNSAEERNNKHDRSPKAEMKKKVEKVKNKKTSKENIPKMTKPSVIAKKIGSPMSKIGSSKMGTPMKKMESPTNKTGSPTRKIESPMSKIGKGSPEKVKNFQKKTAERSPKKRDGMRNAKSKLRGKQTEKKTEMNGEIENKISMLPKKVTIVLKNNTIQGPIDYYKSVRKSPSIPFDSSKKPTKTNLKPNSTPSPINPFFKKKLRLRF